MSGPLHETGPFLEPARRAIRSWLGLLPWWLAEFVLFGLKMAWACLFAALMLGLILLTRIIWQADWPVHRYDALFLAAISIQALLLALGMERWEEARVILVYHVVGTLMEVFKVRMGSWAYPEPAMMQIAGVPLFSGFMYASVGSFMVRSIRIFDMRFTSYPRKWVTVVLALTIYANFYLHHYWIDIRIALFAATLVIFRRVNIHFTTDRTTLFMPLILAAFLSAFFLWIAENVGTLTGTWIYPGQTGWHLVSSAKIGSWYLLLFVSFVLVTLVLQPKAPDSKLASAEVPSRLPRPDRGGT
jgi:uncharacterized membrane protein YoaT (DUF817 family)